MLQPSQLTDVAREYAAEVVELRAFLAKAGVPIRTSQAIASVASRVQHDRAFHRDLTATLWVTTEGGDRQIGFADLLGVLAIASAGVPLASEAEEQDALALLQYLKEIRRTRKPDAESSRAMVTANASAPHESQIVEEPVFAHVARRNSTGPEGSADVHTAQPLLASAGAPLGPSRNRSRWVIAGASLLFALLLAGWLYRHSFVAERANQQAAGKATSTSSSPQRTPAATVSSPDERDGRRTSSMRPEAHRSSNIGVQKALTPAETNAPEFHPPARPGSGSAVPAGTASTTAAPVNNELAANLPTAFRPAPNLPAAVSVPKAATRPSSALPIPASTLSKRLGASTLPQYATEQSGQGVADAPKRPRLLRRHPSVNGDPGLVAELQPLDNPATRSQSSSAGTPVGSVRPTALGIMAANVLYSPAPPYPVAASAAHVTGEVKLEAEIDRDGTVTYARVVSGPPLLRDAALNAVQQWRYRPYLSRGKPVPVTAVAVMDFQLP